MDNLIPEGIPSEEAYKRLLDSAIFKEMEQFSEQFLASNGAVLDQYAKQWVADPLHQWSRQWEYPFVYQQVKTAVHPTQTTHILDAGSGVTFFPYWLATRFEGTAVSCCDYDKNLDGIFTAINKTKETQVNFSAADLRDLPYPDASFDIIYCISVLEHTRAYDTIVAEFARVLRPGGRLIVTFDISIDGTRDIDIARGNTLLSTLQEYFMIQDDLVPDLQTHLTMPNRFTTLSANRINPDWLPWQLPAFLYQAKTLLFTGKRVSWPPELTVFCLCLNKPVR